MYLSHMVIFRIFKLQLISYRIIPSAILSSEACSVLSHDPWSWYKQKKKKKTQSLIRNQPIKAPGSSHLGAEDSWVQVFLLLEHRADVRENDHDQQYMQLENHFMVDRRQSPYYEVHVPTRAPGLKSSNHSELIKAHDFIVCIFCLRSFGAEGSELCTLCWTNNTETCLQY